MVLTQAQLILYKNEKRIGVAEYKLHAGGLLNSTKYKSNESKIEPLSGSVNWGNSIMTFMKVKVLLLAC